MYEVISQDLLGWVTIGFCLVFSAFFSASETAITSLGVIKTKHLIEINGQNTKHLKFWLDQPNRVLTTILIFNNVVNILASAVATEMAIRHFGSNSIGIATGGMTFLVLVFGEIVPKSFARANHELIAQISLKILHGIYIVAFPFVWFFSGFASWILRALGSKQNLRPTMTEEELEFIINEGGSSGVIEGLKRSMISGVFDFDETKVNEIMTPRPDVEAIERDAPLEEVIRLIVNTGHSRIPVYEERIDNVVGILFAKDFLRFASNGQSYETVKISSIMREPFFVPESKLIMDVFKDLKRTKNHLAIVIDEYGGTAGIVTMEDILEEIVGDIQDEYDVEEAKILELAPDVYDVAGSINIDEFKEYFQLDDTVDDEDHEDVDTVAGWMILKLGEMPKVGQSIEVGHLNVQVSEVGRHRIERVRVNRMAPEALEQDAQS